jgi:RNA polymerase sigma-70 factor (ECF subfamily)
VIDRALEKLKREWEEAGRGERFRVLSRKLIDNGEPRDREAYRQLGLSDSAARVAVYRLRQRFGEILREEVAQTLATQDDLEDEVRCLLLALKP